MAKSKEKKPKQNEEKSSIRMREAGDQALLTIGKDERVPLLLSEIQKLIMYSQLGLESLYTPTKWCQLDKTENITETNILIVQNFSLTFFEENQSSFSFLSSLDLKVEVVNPDAHRDDFIKSLLMVPLTTLQVASYKEKFGSLDKAGLDCDDVFDMTKSVFPIKKGDDSTIDIISNDRFPRTQLLLSGWQLIEEGFPLPINGLVEKKWPYYVLTKNSYLPVTAKSPMFAMDVEMCQTTAGMELTRISLVDEQLATVYDHIVKPGNRIIDFLTRLSGITPKIIKKATKTLKQVQEDLKKILPADAILIGHSLVNDMHAVRMMHPYVIDTSVIFNTTGERNRKTKLKMLSKHYLGDKIQDSKSGHSSVEDSIGCMKLVQLKLRNSISFGDKILNNPNCKEDKVPQSGCKSHATSLIKQLAPKGNSVQIVSFEKLIVKYRYYTYKDNAGEKVNFSIENSNEEVVNRLSGTEDRCRINLGHVLINSKRLKDDSAGVSSTIDNWGRRVCEAAKEGSLNLVIFSGKMDDSGCCFIYLK